MIQCNGYVKSGVASCLSGSRTFCPAFAGQTYVSQDRQHDGGVIYKQARGTRSLPLLQLTRKLLTWSSELLASLRAVNVPGHLRQPAGQEVAFAPADIGTDLGSVWQSRGGSFCVSREHTLPTVVSITDGIGPLGVDALSYAWPKTLLYAFPPVDLIQPTLDRVCQEGLSLIQVAPCWPAKTWYTIIVALLSGMPWCTRLPFIFLKGLDG